MVFVLQKICIANRRLCARCLIFDFIWGIVYEHTFNRYPREWSSYNSWPIKVVNQQLHWYLLNLHHGKKNHLKLSIMGICIAIPLAKAATCTSSEIHQYHWFHSEPSKVTWNYFAQFLTLPKVGPGGYFLLGAHLAWQVQDERAET